MQYKILFSLSAALFFTATLSAQNPKPKIENQSVEVINSFNARLIDATKLTVTPTLPKLDTATKHQDIIVPPRPLTIKYEAPKLKPLAIKAGAKEEQYRGYLKAGGGIPSSWYGEAGYYFGGKKIDGKAWIRHHQAKFKDLEGQQFSNTDFLLSGLGKLNKTTSLEAKAGYGYHRVHYYGYDHEIQDFDLSRIRQNFKIIDISARLFNGERNDADANYHVTPKFYSLNDNYANKETGFDLRLGADKWFNEQHVLRMNIGVDLTKYNDSVTQKLNNIYLQPSFTLHFDFMRLKIGGNFASNRDIFHIYPDAELNLRIFGDGIQVFVGAGGDLRKNTFRSLSEYNPFIQMRLSELRNTDYRNYYGGVRGNFGWLDYSVQGGYATANDLALYQTTFIQDGITRFRTLYDTAKIYNLQGTIRFNPIKPLTITGTLSNNIYDTEHEISAWGLPSLEGNFAGNYAFLEGKANLKANFYLADDISYRDEADRGEHTGWLYDLGLGASYYFSKNVGLFLDVNNLLANKRERWYNYPMYGVNILGGITARF